MARSDRKTRARLEFLEWEARRRPRVHRLRLIGLALLGYLYPAALVLVSFALLVAVLALAPAALVTLEGITVLYYVALVLAALLLTVAVACGFLVSLPDVDGHPLSPGDAAPLRAMVEDVRRRIGAPPVHHIHVDAKLNAAAAQRQRFGFWGARTNYLFVGLPLLAALTPEQVRVVLAHELGHLLAGHNSFPAWIYRVQQTWATLEAPFRTAPWLRRVAMGWFVSWFGGYFSVSTLALRRVHEYEADRRGADAAGAAATAGALAGMAWASYRLERELWPALFREAGRDPLPPNDVTGRIAALLASPPRAGALARWRRRERGARTPVTEEHPTLADRLDAIGCRAVLESESEDGPAPGVPAAIPPEMSALSLLGETRQKLTAVANASWKALAIAPWRMEHAAAKEMREAAAKRAAAGEDGQTPDAQWERLRADADYSPPDEALRLLREFLSRHPGHGGASFAAGQLLLRLDDDEAASHLEAAIAGGSDFIGPSLHMLLDHYRESGRDAEADAVRVRLEAHEKALSAARTERLKVSRRDRFVPHDLKPQDVEKIRRLLFRYPQVRAAYLARKQVRLFADKPSYVLALKRTAWLLEDNRKADSYLVESIRSQVEQPCAVVVLGATSYRLRSRLLRVCQEPVFEAND